MTTESPPARISLLLSDAQLGGVERCLLNLARGFSARGFAVELLNQRWNAALPPPIDPRIERVALAAGDPLPALVEHLRRTPPAVLVAAKDGDCALAIAARRRLPQAPRVFLVASVNFSAQLAGRRAGLLARWRRYRELRRLYGGGDALICVSQGVADDLAAILGRAREALIVLPNPVVMPELATLARAPLAHPWFAPGQPPVVLGMGRLGRIKNFPLLLRAFARVRAERDCRLVVLGEGKHRQRLLRLAARLGVAESVDLPGFQANPFAFMARAALFVLSSRWEGFGNALVEAMACGTPVVATDCPSGPAEILQGGRVAPLVPVNDEAALSAAMLDQLNAPADPERLRQAVAPYTLEASTLAYLRAFGLA